MMKNMHTQAHSKPDQNCLSEGDLKLQIFDRSL